MSDYERLMCAFRKLHTPSTATVLHPLPRIHMPERVQKETAAPKLKRTIESGPAEELWNPTINKLKEGRDVILNHIQSELKKKKGMKLVAGAAGLDLKQNMKDISKRMKEFMRLCVNQETLLQNNTTDPSTFLQQAIDALTRVEQEYTQSLDSFLNYNVAVGQNLEEGETSQEVQSQELMVQSLFPLLAEQAGLELEDEQLWLLPQQRKPSQAERSKRRRAPVTRKKKEEEEEEEVVQPQTKKAREAENVVLEAARNMSVLMLNMSVWSFHTLRFRLPEMSQFHSALQNGQAYFRLLVDSADESVGREIEIRTKKQKARKALQKLGFRGETLLDLRSQQLAESSSLWNYALRRFKDFLSDEAANKLLPGFLAMIIQSSTGYLLATMNNTMMAKRVTERAEEEEQRQLSTIERMKSVEERLKALQEFQGPGAQLQRRKFLFDLYMEATQNQLTAANFHSTLEKLRYLAHRSDTQEELMIYFDAWRVLLNEMLQLTHDDPVPFFDFLDRLRLLNADEVLDTENGELYEENRDLLNQLAASFGGELQPVTRATADLPCVLQDSVCANVDKDLQLPGAADFLQTNVKFLHRIFGNVKEFQDFVREHPGIDLWSASRDAAIKVMVDVPGPMLDRLVAVKDLKNLPLTRSREALAQGDEAIIAALKEEHPQQFRVASMKRISDAIYTATQERIANTAKPIPIENLQEEAGSLNRDAAWEAMGNMLARGSSNTLMNNLLLSVLASISRARLGFHLMDLLQGSQDFLGRILPNVLGVVPRLASAALQYGLARNMLGLAAMHGIVGSTRVAEEWDAYLDDTTGRKWEGVPGKLHTLYRWLLKGLRGSAEMSLQFYGYINQHAMAGWIAFGVLLAFQGLSTTLWDVGVVGMGLAAVRSAIQSSSLIVLAGAEGALHELLRRNMTRYVEEQRKAIERAREGEGEEDVAAADAAQTALYWSPIRWAIGGSMISLSINTARLLFLQNSALWNGLFQADFGELDPVEGPSGALFQSWLKELELSLTGSEDYSGRRTFNEAIIVAVQAAAGKT